MPLAVAPTITSEPRVRAAIAKAASSTGVDFRYLYDQARTESGLNPQAKAATSSAAGLFQFTKQTWLQILKTHGADHGASWATNVIERDGSRLKVSNPTQQAAIDNLRLDPEFSSMMAAEFAQDNKGRLEDGLGRAVDPTELYLAHFLGSAGAVKFLTAYDANRDAAAAPLFPAAAAANRSVFYGPDGAPRSLQDIRANFADKLSGGIEPALSTLPPLTPVQHWVQNRRSVVESSPAPALEMAAMEALPSRLSLEFAARAYQRLAGIGA